jgi:hypothetical protein
MMRCCAIAAGLYCTMTFAHMLSLAFLTAHAQIDIAEGFGAGDAKKLEGITDAASACDLHPAAGNIMYCCSEMLEYSACYRKMRELAVTYFTKYIPLPPLHTAIPRDYLDDCVPSETARSPTRPPPTSRSWCRLPTSPRTRTTSSTSCLRTSWLPWGYASLYFSSQQ